MWRIVREEWVLHFLLECAFRNCPFKAKIDQWSIEGLHSAFSLCYSLKRISFRPGCDDRKGEQASTRNIFIFLFEFKSQGHHSSWKHCSQRKTLRNLKTGLIYIEMGLLQDLASSHWRHFTQVSKNSSMVMTSRYLKLISEQFQAFADISTLFAISCLLCSKLIPWQEEPWPLRSIRNLRNCTLHPSILLLEPI